MKDKTDVPLDEVLPSDIKASLNIMADYLSSNLEYKGSGKTGNHVINNARALLFASILLNNNFFLNLSYSILKKSLHDLISDDGFLREGSSHYQFIFTRWILEMLWLSKISNNCDIYDFLHPFSSKLVKQCRFFIVEGSDDDLLIPLIGDVSPDFPVSWLSTLPCSTLARNVYGNCEIRNSKNDDYGWTTLMDKLLELYPIAK